MGLGTVGRLAVRNLVGCHYPGIQAGQEQNGRQRLHQDSPRRVRHRFQPLVVRPQQPLRPGPSVSRGEYDPALRRCGLCGHQWRVPERPIRRYLCRHFRSVPVPGRHKPGGGSQYHDLHAESSSGRKLQLPWADPANRQLPVRPKLWLPLCRDVCIRGERHPALHALRDTAQPAAGRFLPR